jgi:redox-sensitive bicupin YhaK (pirin superfamily)
MGGEMHPSMTDSFKIQRAGERAFFDFGWLQTHHSFSFAGYHDRNNVNWGALRVFNDDVVQPGMGFGTHPHRDMEILTYVLEGNLEHKDSLGNAGVVGPGAVQYVSAGTGVSHSEFNHSSERPVHFVQMWVLPRALGLAPRYGQVDYTRAERLNAWLPIASGEEHVESRIALWQDATAYVARLEEGSLSHAVRPERFAFLFLAQGQATVNGELLSSGDAVRIAGPYDLAVAGNAELVLWDVPAVDRAAA